LVGAAGRLDSYLFWCEHSEVGKCTIHSWSTVYVDLLLRVKVDVDILIKVRVDDDLLLRVKVDVDIYIRVKNCLLDGK